MNCSMSFCLDELLAQFPFHEGIGGNHSHAAGWLSVFAFHGQGKELFHERRSQRVFPVAGLEAQAVGVVERSVLDGDIGRVAHHRFVVPAEVAARQFGVLGLVEMFEGVFERVVTAEEGLPPVFPAGRAAVQEGIARGDMHLESRGVRKPVDVAHM
jgi:hypothetical protein